MNVAALIAWLVTALGGFYLLGKWLTGGGIRGTSRFPVPVIFGHFLLAAAGLVVWIVFLLAHTKALAWTAFVILVPVAGLGFTILAAGLFAGQPNVTVIPGDWTEIAREAPYDLLVLDGGGTGQERPAADPETLLRPGGTLVIDDLTPASSWPPRFEGQPDPCWTHWHAHPAVRIGNTGRPRRLVIGAAMRL